MAQVYNPYVVGSPISGETGFYGREDIFDFVRTTLSTPGQNVAVLYGQRRIGKTSILHQLPWHMPPEFAPVYLDLQGQARRPLPHVLYDLARRIARTLDLPTPTRDAFKRNGSFFQTDFLSQALEALGQRRLVLLFDEFDTLSDDPLLPQDAFKTFFPYLQQLIQDRSQLAFVLVVGRRIDELPSHFGQIFKTAQFKPVSRLSPRSARRLVEEPARGLLHYADDAVDRILTLTANHPYFTQLLCSVIFEQARQLGSDTVAVEQVDEAIEDALEQGEGGLGWIWDGLPGAERIVLSAVACVADELRSVNNEQLRRVLEENNVKLLGPELTSAPQRLLAWDILTEAEDGSLRFVVELVRCWICHQHPLGSATRDLGYVSQRAARLYDNARDAHLAGDFETAISDYRQALIANPNHPWAPRGLAQALFATGLLAEAVQAFEDAFRRGDEAARDGLVEAAFALANVHTERKRWAEAFRLFDRALALRPDRDDIRGAKLEAKFAQGANLKEEGQLLEAVEIFREIIREDGESEETGVKNRVESALIEAAYELASKAENWSSAVKWLREVVERDPNYKDAVSLLEDAQKQSELAILYDQGQQALNAKDWETARDRLKMILEIDPAYKNAGDLYYEVYKTLELPKLYSQASEQLHHQDWDEAIKNLTLILDLDLHYRDTLFLLDQARQKKRIEEDYQRALEQYARAERTDQESDWREAATSLQEIADKDPGYKAVGARLVHTRRRLRVFELYQKGKEYFAREKWQDATAYLERAVDLDPRDSNLATMLAEAREKSREQETTRHRKMLELYEKGSDHYQRKEWEKAIAYLEAASAIEPFYTDLPTKLGETRKKLRQRRAMTIALGIMNVAIFTIAIVVFANQLAVVGDSIVGWWSEIRAASTPSVAMPGIDKIEVLMNGVQLNLNRLPTLSSGQVVELEAIVVDTNGKRYMGDDLVCRWSVAPLSDEDIGINTGSCKAPYTPSQEYSTQIVLFEVEGRDQQFEPGDPISLEFDIAK